MLPSDRRKSLSEEPHDEPEKQAWVVGSGTSTIPESKKIEKQKMLDEFTSATGYHRKHAIRVLKNQVQVQKNFNRKTKTYKTRYRDEVVQALKQIRETCGQICSKWLQPYLPEAIKVLECHAEIRLSKDTKDLLLKISSASIDRCWRPVRLKVPSGLSATKSGNLQWTLCYADLHCSGWRIHRSQ